MHLTGILGVLLLLWTPHSRCTQQAIGERNAKKEVSGGCCCCLSCNKTAGLQMYYGLTAKEIGSCVEICIQPDDLKYYKELHPLISEDYWGDGCAISGYTTWVDTKILRATHNQSTMGDYYYNW